jgi:hypothetical protein
MVAVTYAPATADHASQPPSTSSSFPACFAAAAAAAFDSRIVGSLKFVSFVVNVVAPLDESMQRSVDVEEEQEGSCNDQVVFDASLGNMYDIDGCQREKDGDLRELKLFAPAEGIPTLTRESVRMFIYTSLR